PFNLRNPANAVNPAGYSLAAWRGRRGSVAVFGWAPLRERFCRIQPASLVPAFLWIEQYRKLWEDRIDSFEEYLMELKLKQTKNDTNS
ncbi:MAG: hypothetical protein AAF391_12275, partial [Bacteroidota bacterium]